LQRVAVWGAQPEGGARPRPDTELVIANARFDEQRLVARAGKRASVGVDNLDVGVLHNFSVCRLEGAELLFFGPRFSPAAVRGPTASSRRRRANTPSAAPSTSRLFRGSWKRGSQHRWET
jgi:hypothetical protein